MLRIFLSMLVFAALAAVPCRANAPALLAHWVQMAPGGEAEARAVIKGTSCPRVKLDGIEAPMRMRAEPDAAFPVLICALTLPKNIATASVLGANFPVPKSAPLSLVVLGDTGCRIKGITVQACNDPAKWPFPEVASEAARLKPSLAIHVGDFLYRESACPAGNAGCAGTPWGDNWATWNADFFSPAAPLLAAAPWVIVRGNHEECARAGAGWLRLLGPLEYKTSAPCTDHIAPYGVPVGGLTLAVMDDAHAPDLTAPDDLVRLYRADFAAIGKLGPAPVWLVMHRPIWGVVEVGMGMVWGGNRTLMAARDEDGLPGNLALLVAGHIHTFEAINYAKGAPPQILAGEGGDLLDQAPRDLGGETIGTMKIADGLSLPGYGFLDFTRVGSDWSIAVLSAAGGRERTCRFAARHLDCGAK